MKKFNLGTVKVNTYPSGSLHGLVLNRDITVREARYIMKNIFFIVINTFEECDDAEDYKFYNDELTKTVNEWLRGERDDDYIMEYASDCMDEPLGLINMLPLIIYLKKRGIID